MARSPYGNYGHAILTAAAMSTPDRVALTYCGERSFTYDELNRTVNRRAHALLAAGVTPGRRVAAAERDAARGGGVPGAGQDRRGDGGAEPVLAG